MSASSSAAPANDGKMWVVKLYGAVEGSIHSFTREALEKCVRVERVDIPTPRAGQLLIRVAKSGILPMNLSELKATYGTWNHDDTSKGTVIGSEGSGTVVASGGGLLAWRFAIGARVAFFKYNAAWAEYACVPANQVFELPAGLPFYKGVAAFANPFTCLAFFEIAEAAGSKTIIHTAAGSALGIMVLKHFKRNGYNVIAVVRGDHHIEACQQAGALATLNYQSPTFFKDLKELAEKHGAKVAFDAVAGELTGTVLSAMPNRSTIYVYGGLSEQRPVIGTRDLIFKGKSCTGFWLKDYAADKWSVGLWNWTRAVAAQLDGDFATAIGASFKLTDVIDAVLAYSKTNGKVVLICDPSLTESD